MPQEDKLKRETDRLAQAMAKVLSELLGAKTQAAAHEAFAQTTTVFRNELGMDPGTFVLQPERVFMDFLRQKQLTPGQLQLTADVLYQLAEKGNPQPNDFYEKALFLYTQLNTVGNTWSLDRHNKIETIKKILNR